MQAQRVRLPLALPLGSETAGRQQCWRECKTYWWGFHASWWTILDSFTSAWLECTCCIHHKAKSRGRRQSGGTGDACILDINLRTDGRVVMDCHAAVIARKALVNWFYCRQIYLLYSNDTVAAPTVFEYNQQSCVWKETVSIHCYLSTAPRGDASAFPAENAPIGLLRESEAEQMNNGDARADVWITWTWQVESKALCCSKLCLAFSITAPAVCESVTKPVRDANTERSTDAVCLKSEIHRIVQKNQ